MGMITPHRTAHVSVITSMSPILRSLTSAPPRLLRRTGPYSRSTTWAAEAVCRYARSWTQSPGSPASSSHRKSVRDGPGTQRGSSRPVTSQHETWTGRCGTLWMRWLPPPGPLGRPPSRPADGVECADLVDEARIARRRGEEERGDTPFRPRVTTNEAARKARSARSEHSERSNQTCFARRRGEEKRGDTPFRPRVTTNEAARKRDPRGVSTASGAIKRVS